MAVFAEIALTFGTRESKVSPSRLAPRFAFFDQKRTRIRMKYFTSKAYLVVFERPFGYDRTYGVARICNKKSEAERELAHLQKENDTLLNKTYYKIVEASLTEETDLFEFRY